eukprot:COSAG06_NODE_409_length_16096_cov_27.922548_2_plen_315_part_00
MCSVWMLVVVGALAQGAAAQEEITLSSTAYVGGACGGTRRQECGIDDSAAPTDGSDCPAHLLIDVPVQTISAQSGECLTAATDPGRVLVLGDNEAIPQISVHSAKMTCTAGKLYWSYYSDTQCRNVLPYDDIDNAQEQYVHDAFTNLGFGGTCAEPCTTDPTCEEISPNCEEMCTTDGALTVPCTKVRCREDRGCTYEPTAMELVKEYESRVAAVLGPGIVDGQCVQFDTLSFNRFQLVDVYEAAGLSSEEAEDQADVLIEFFQELTGWRDFRIGGTSTCASTDIALKASGSNDRSPPVLAVMTAMLVALAALF